MRWRKQLTVITFATIAVSLVSCRGVPQPIDGPDRTETVAVTGGECKISWWLSPLADEIPGDAQAAAEQTLEEAQVNDADWEEWRTLLANDPDVEWTSDARLDGAAYLEVVRAHVRDALALSGYPDTDRIIEVYSDLTCST